MFKKSLTGKVTLKISEVEKAYLVQFLEQTVELIDAPEVIAHEDPLMNLFGPEGPTEISEDPALARLFPQAYTNDDEASSDFRKYSEPDLRQKKATAAAHALAMLNTDEEKIAIDPDDAQAWLMALNDLRLILGTRLGIGSTIDDDHEEHPLYPFYGWLTYLQGTLVEAL